MADFRTHVTFSSVLGCGYSVAGMMTGVAPSTALVAGGLCGVAGMLPDVDSDSGIPRRESMGFAAAIVPMLLVDRFKQMQLSHDQMVFTGAAIYFFIRFVAAKFIGKWSVHRGMWHSIPAVLIFAGVTFLIAGPADNLSVRYFKAFAVGLGAMSHLLLDEIYSVDTRGVVPKFKKSFGTAIKLSGKSGWANFSTYLKLAIVVMMIVGEPHVMARIEIQNPQLADRLKGYQERIGEYTGRGTDSFEQPAGNQPQASFPFASSPQGTNPSQPPSPALPFGGNGGGNAGSSANYQGGAFPTTPAPNYNESPSQYPNMNPNNLPGAPPVEQRLWQQSAPAPGRSQPFSAQAPAGAPGIRRQ